MEDRNCQYCGKYNSPLWVPAGAICNNCKKNIDRIRKYKLGIPKIRLSKAMRESDK